MRKTVTTLFCLALLAISCAKFAQKGIYAKTEQKPARAAQHTKEILSKTSIKIAAGLDIKLWATDSLAPDPIAMSIDHQGRVFITRSTRHKNSEFDIRGHRDWMTESIGMQTVEDKRAFYKRTLAPERSKQNEWLKDLNFDGSHDWRDLTVEKEEVWRVEDRNRDGVADVSTRVVHDFHEEITDVAAGLLVRENDMFIGVGPDLWRLEDKNKDGIMDTKTSISRGYGVHVGFGGHNMSGIVEGPDGRIYWNIGDIGATVTTVDGRTISNPNSGFIARANPDGSDFEIFATGLRNTHEFAFDQYGNLISEDNDGDYPGESERLVHIVEGSDAGWRSNWQYGKYTDPDNNRYNVWIDEKMYVPRWFGQAAYIIPPIQNYHNGPTGFVYNPGTALGSDWVNRFFVAEFVGTTANSNVWSFGLKPKGASFELYGDTMITTGILPTALQFGPDGALYIGDWIIGWETKDYGRIWRIDVSADKNDLAALRAETQRRLQLRYRYESLESLYQHLFFGDYRIRQKAQFELVRRGDKGMEQLVKATSQRDNQLARIHGIWGIGQMARFDKQKAASLLPLLRDADPEIATQAIRMLGDAEIADAAPTMVELLRHTSLRVRFYAAEALGQLKYAPAVQPLLNMLEANDDEDVYLRHAAVLALTRIGAAEAVLNLVNHPKRAMRIAAVLVLRRLKHEKVALFLRDISEYVATEAARAINDDLSIPEALPALAGVLSDRRFSGEPLLRRAINAASRVGTDRELSLLLHFAQRSEVAPALRAEALAALGVWANPSLLDRVDGRYRTKVSRDVEAVRQGVRPVIPALLREKDPKILAAVADLFGRLKLREVTGSVRELFQKDTAAFVRAAMLKTLNQLEAPDLSALIERGMTDSTERVRTTALGLLSDVNVTAASLPVIAKSIFSSGTNREQQQLLMAMAKLDKAKTIPVLTDLIARRKADKLPPTLMLELKEAVLATESATLKADLEAINAKSPLAEYADALYGGNVQTGREIFLYYGPAQCTRCHSIDKDGSGVGPNLAEIGSRLTREQILEAIVDPSARIAPGYGNVGLTLKDGQQYYGVLAKETDEEITLTTNDAEPLFIAKSRIVKRENLPSSMPAFGETLSRREIRHLVEFLVGSKTKKREE
jgi:quinoprotein glucose dehydrogenase